MSKGRKAMSISEQYPISGTREVDEILIGGKKEGKPGRGAQGKKKVSVVVEKDPRGGIKRVYCMKIANFSTQELRKIFDRHIHLDAVVETDLWRSYQPLKETWNISQSKSNPPENFKAIHRFIQQLKGWIRGIYHHISDEHLQGYLDEFCFRINRHLFRENIFNRLTLRMMEHQPVPKHKLVS